MAEKCKECGCICAECRKNEENHIEMHLHVEIEHLRQRLLERDSHIVTMETQFLNEADKFPNGELASIKEEMLTWQEKYSRLYEAHKRVQKVNQNLEDKLLRIVDKCETEKSAFTKDIATLSHRLADANYTIQRLTQDNEKYRNDVNLAIQLLQCKPSNFVSQRYDSLPTEVQAKVRTYVTQKRIVSNTSEVLLQPPDVKSITVPISTFPPTAMVYNITKPNNIEKDSDDESDDSKPPVDIVSASIMAKVLEERERERVFAKHCDTCTCHRSILTNEAETQTDNFLSNSYNHYNNDKYTENNSTNKTGLGGQQTLGKSSKEEIEWSDLNSNNSSLPSGGMSFQYVNEKPFVTNNSSRNEKSQILSTDNKKNGKYNLISDALHYQQPQQQQQQQYHSNKKINLQSPMKHATFNNTVDKISQQNYSGRNMKKSDSQTTYRLSSSKSQQSAKYEPLPSVDAEDLIKDVKSQRDKKMDLINDRIWKNDWSFNKSSGMKSTEIVQSALEETMDVINDRTWKTIDSVHKPVTTTGKPRLTLIEVEPLAIDSSGMNSHQQNDPRLHQSEDATASPSFSSDSLVISSSDPPSTSSDAISQLGNNKSLNKTSFNNINNNLNNSLMSNWQDRTTGPRGCSMRITPGSKNILLDNAGNYQTVLYTTGGSRPNTAALVHSPKSNKSGGSNSNSDDNSSTSPSPVVLPNDNTQLQRVAEWIKASGPIERQANSKNNDDDMSIKTLNNALSKIKDGKSMGNDKKSNVENSKIGIGSDTVILGKQIPQSLALKNSTQNIKIDFSRDLKSDINVSLKDDNEDLITFDSPIDDQDDNQVFEFSKSGEKILMDVKVTREMEETYLKLAASLDPDNLKLSSTESADITIEKYRKEYKKTQLSKNHDKSTS